mmetsp:Transcript_76382/g.159052  ORF Transcript_76382/g.159052 Transcript_76382/m.159052 type:complete len:572 (-) Transcript_76382:361-2076(-)|eukprot:CAMPEP_0206448524 /NCGR_PEP_ID=MMETSP0324_2-20121206/17523_1 /ASSEMBLY_ACC=CAM_ASM_000836 /TAXON_ID=2866 /ORGANISM="Crypthecodinium cohnii, Strain Seligo" /LENGTH=571 /DNA_ID=CAMNT_0053917683 /DNA_START=54 /DNA_END=1769 /DNA_ORIENTATION=-
MAVSSKMAVAAVLAALSHVAVAAAIGGVVSVEPPVQQLPSSWRVAGPAPADHLLELTFAVKQRGRKELEETLLRVSDPENEHEYGWHMTNFEVQMLTSPREEDIAAVEDFLRSHGLEPRWASSNGDFVKAVTSVEVAEKLLSATYSKVSHTSGQEVHRALSGYSLPPNVAAAVDFVYPTTHLPSLRQPLRSAVSKAEDSYNSPKNLRELYQVGSTEGKAASNKQAVTAFLEQGYTTDSLQAFWNKFCDGIKCGKGLPKLIGDATGGSPGTESMLDIETITGVAGNVESEFWGFSGRSHDNPENEPFMKWLEQLSNTSDAEVPKVFSTSYGEDESSWSEAAAARLNTEFQKAGVRGISLLFASGDNGPNCKVGHFNPNGPASSPWVTAVGGTSAGSSWPQPGSDAETAIGLGSGGFSNYWKMPEWQKDAAAAYLKQSGVPSPSDKGFNTSGRAFPDISAQAQNFFVYAGFPEPGVAGTSCASPTAAGIFALLNDARLQAGKSTLGFLNPFIYKHADAFNDVTTGSSESSCGEWPATKGWDAATGVGTPNYEKLAKVVAGLPAGQPLEEAFSV